MNFSLLGFNSEMLTSWLWDVAFSGCFLAKTKPSPSEGNSLGWSFCWVPKRCLHLWSQHLSKLWRAERDACLPGTRPPARKVENSEKESGERTGRWNLRQINPREEYRWKVKIQNFMLLQLSILPEKHSLPARICVSNLKVSSHKSLKKTGEVTKQRDARQDGSHQRKSPSSLAPQMHQRASGMCRFLYLLGLADRIGSGVESFSLRRSKDASPSNQENEGATSREQAPWGQK